jgi:hypothetical protein
MLTVKEGGKGTFKSEDAKQYNEKVKLGMTFNPKELITPPKSWCRGWGRWFMRLRMSMEGMRPSFSVSMGN